MLRFRRSTAAALLVGAAVVSTPASAVAVPVAALSPAVLTAAAGWTYYATYGSLPDCQAAGSTNSYGATRWECRGVAGKYELWVWI